MPETLSYKSQMTLCPSLKPYPSPSPPISPKHSLPVFPHVTFYLLLHTSLYSVILPGYFIGLSSKYLSFQPLILPVGSRYRLLFSLAFSRISFPSRVRRNSFVLPQENPRSPKRFKGGPDHISFHHIQDLYYFLGSCSH